MCNTGCPNKFWSHFSLIMHEMINSNAHLRPLHRARVLQKKKNCENATCHSLSFRQRVCCIWWLEKRMRHMTYENWDLKHFFFFESQQHFCNYAEITTVFKKNYLNVWFEFSLAKNHVDTIKIFSVFAPEMVEIHTMLIFKKVRLFE